jgi:hypothetical protein
MRSMQCNVETVFLSFIDGEGGEKKKVEGG